MGEIVTRLHACARFQQKVSRYGPPLQCQQIDSFPLILSASMQAKADFTRLLKIEQKFLRKSQKEIYAWKHSNNL